MSKVELAVAGNKTLMLKLVCGCYEYQELVSSQQWWWQEVEKKSQPCILINEKNKTKLLYVECLGVPSQTCH